MKIIGKHLSKTKGMQFKTKKEERDDLAIILISISFEMF